MTHAADDPDSEAPTVPVGRHEAGGNGSVLGLTITDDAIVSVVRGPAGDIVASNIVDLEDGTSEESAFDAITELIDSVPMAVDAIGIAASRQSTGDYLARQFAPGVLVPAWVPKVRMVDFPVALAEVARVEPTRGGVIAVVDLDAEGVPSAGRSIITVDVQSGAIVGTAEFNDGSPAPITEPEGANAVADAVTTMPGGASVAQVLCTGTGAELPGVAPAFEYAVARPVSIATAPTLAGATGAAISAQRLSAEPVGTTVRTPVAAVVDKPEAPRRRWWPAAAAIVGALLLGGIVGALIGGGSESEPETVSNIADATATVTRTTTKKITRPRTTVTTTVSGNAATVTETVKSNAAPTGVRTVTRTAADTKTRTATVTETVRDVETVTITEPPQINIPPETITITDTVTVQVPAG